MKTLAINFIRRHKPVQIFLAFIGLVILTAIVGKIFPVFAGTILCLLLLGGYYGILFQCLKFCNVNFLEVLKNDLPRILLTSALATGFIIFIVSLHNTIHISDSLETWEPTIYCEENTFSNVYIALKGLRWSINHADYNNFLPMLMTLPMHIFGKSFLCYVLYVWIMFALPGIFFAAATFKGMLEKAGFKNFPCSALMALIMIFPALEIPLVFGYANISILLPGAIILAMLLSLDRAQLQRDRLFWIAVLCIFAVFQARTAVYMLIGMFWGYTLYTAILGLQEKNFLRDFLLLIKKFLYIGAFGLIITLPLFFTFIKHALTYDIGTIYSAYQFGMDFPTRIFVHANYLGLLIYQLFIIGIIVSLFNKKLFPYAIFFATWFFTAELLICRIQFIDRQHIYTMILPFAFIFIMLTAVTLSKRKKICAALLLILAINFVQPYFPSLNSYGFFSGKYEIVVRHDIDDLKNFVADMKELTSNNNKKIFGLLHSFFYNVHTLGKIYLPENHNALPNLFGSGNVDLRDGFAINFFDADYVIVLEPFQNDLQAQDQTIILKPYELITTPSPISRHFKQIKEYTFSLDGISTVKFKLYEKISPYEKADIDFVENIFEKLYPNQPELFKNRFENYKREHFGG